MSSRIALSIVLLLLLTTSVQVLATEEAPPVENEAPVCNADRSNWTVGLLYCTGEASQGYTLFSPIPSNTTYLIDEKGRHVHEWASPGEHRPALSAYLLPDGDLLRTANNANNLSGNFSGGGTSGKIERISWDGVLEWSWNYDDVMHVSHHDIEPMPNGNILLIAWEERSEEEALQAGRNPDIASDSPGGENNVWPDHIVEVKPIGTDGAEIVWRWHAWDHLVQDYDPTKNNYGTVADHPGRLDINYIGGTGNAAGRADWMHCNGIDYNSELDQIALSCRSMNEIYIIDHSTTTEEAAGTTGGNSGKGGEILYRWGNPQVYDHGLSSDQQLFAQHDVQWVEAGHAEEGALVVYNNGNGRYPAYSSVDIIQPPMVNGSYIAQTNGTYGPNGPVWSWSDDEGMYSGSISGAQTLPNGNVLVTHGTQGTLYEVNPSGDIVWHYVGPVGAAGTFAQGEPVPEGNRAGTTANAIFKATHYSDSHPALVNRSLTSTKPLENWTDACPHQNAWGWDSDGDGCTDDTDGDGVLDPNDRCDLGDDNVDLDNDGTPDACDNLVDSDGDGVSDAMDTCEGHDDAIDEDQDGLPEPCDTLLDRDNDTVADDLDRCDGHDDRLDTDADGQPDGCDELTDSDGDGVSDEDDACPGQDDGLDADVDGIPDGCDSTPSEHEPVNQSNASTENTDVSSGDTNDTNGDSDFQSSGETTRRISAGLLSVYLVFCLLQRSRRKG